MNAISTILVESELKPGLNKRAATAGRVEDFMRSAEVRGRIARRMMRVELLKATPPHSLETSGS